MVRRFHRSIYDELDELRASMDYLYQLALEPTDSPLLPSEDDPGIVCRYLHNLNAEVTGYDDEVMVTVDTAPGNGSPKISVDLIDAETLQITCDCEDESPPDEDGNSVCERRRLSLHHIIPLPARVIPLGAKMSMRHGVLDIRLKRAEPV
jgi:HSP20 family protein